MFDISDHLLIQPEKVWHCQNCGEEMVFFYPFPSEFPDLCEKCQEEKEGDE